MTYLYLLHVLWPLCGAGLEQCPLQEGQQQQAGQKTHGEAGSEKWGQKFNMLPYILGHKEFLINMQPFQKDFWATSDLQIFFFFLNIANLLKRLLSL